MRALTTSSQWLDFLKSSAGDGNLVPGAAEENLVAVEAKLKVTLPPSYRAFLSASNGLKNVSRAVPVLKSAEKIRWFKREHRDWVAAYTAPMQGMDLPLPAEQEYFDYTSESSGAFDIQHLAQTLCISEVGDSAVLLLNPMVVWPDGEWEAWFFADWVPGAIRYRSFAEWMRSEAAERRNEPYQPVQAPGELPTVYRDGPAKENRRIRPREEVLTLDEVRARLRSKTRSRRVKAVQYLCRMGGPDAIAILLDLLRNNHDFHVRCDAAESLGKLRAPEAIEPLIAQTVEYTHVTDSAIRALGYFNDERSAQCLLKLVEANVLSVGVAAYALAARKDARGTKPLVDILLSKDPKDQHTGRIAGRYIAHFEEAGFSALEPLMASDDDEVRERAFLGISDVAMLSKSKELRRNACQLMEQCFAREKPGRLHRWMAISIELAGKKN